MERETPKNILDDALRILRTAAFDEGLANTSDEAIELMKNIVSSYEQLKKTQENLPIPSASRMVMQFRKERIDVFNFIEKNEKFLKFVADGQAYQSMLVCKTLDASASGFMFENVIAYSIIETYRKNEGKDIYIKFPLIHFAIKYAVRGDVFRKVSQHFINIGELLIKDRYYVLDARTRLDFEMMLKLRLGGATKPPGSENTVGPDIAMWLTEDVVMFIGSKTSRMAYNNELSGEKKKANKSLFIRKAEYMDNVRSTDVRYLGMGPKTKDNPSQAVKDFGNRCRRYMCTVKPIKILFRVHSVLPFRRRTQRLSDATPEYIAATEPVSMYEATMEYTTEDGKLVRHRYIEVMINLYGMHYLDSGIFDKNTEDIIKEMYINPVKDLY